MSDFENQWEKARALLSEREWRVLVLRAGIGYAPHTWEEVGEAVPNVSGYKGWDGYPISKERARQIARAALKKLEAPEFDEVRVMLAGACFGRYRQAAKKEA